MRQGARRGIDDVDRRAARPDAPDAQPGARIQRLSLGGPHAARCQRDARTAPLRKATRKRRAPCYPMTTPTPTRQIPDAKPNRSRYFARPQPPPLAREYALFLDIDGTLAEFAATPDEARIDEQLIRALPALR